VGQGGPQEPYSRRPRPVVLPGSLLAHGNLRPPAQEIFRPRPGPAAAGASNLGAGVMLYQITQSTRYQYSEKVGQCLNMAYMLPRNTLRQNCLQASFNVTPLPATVEERGDYFGNRAYYFSIEQDHSILQVSAVSMVEVNTIDQGLALDFGPTCGQVRRRLAESGERETLLAREFVLPSNLVDYSAAFRAYARPFFADDRPFLSAVRALTQQIYQQFEYDPLFSDVTTPLDEVFEHKR